MIRELEAKNLCLDPVELRARLMSRIPVEGTEKYQADLQKSIRCRYSFRRVPVLREGDTLNLGFGPFQSTSLASRLAGCDEAYNQQLQDWLNQQTGDLLKEQTQSISMDSDTMVGLASTVYYSTKWYDEFQKENTFEQTFHATTGDILCDFMHEDYRQKNYYWGDRFSAVYKSFDEGNMLFTLPDEGFSIDELLQDEKALAFLVGDYLAAESKYMKVSLSIPKFDVSYQSELTDALQELGITEVFGADADFSPLTQEKVALSEVQHGTRVAIDEEGCVAAAYTVMQGEGSAQPPEDKIRFVADRPFLFAIYSNGVPLFVGVVNQP